MDSIRRLGTADFKRLGLSKRTKSYLCPIYAKFQVIEGCKFDITNGIPTWKSIPSVSWLETHQSGFTDLLTDTDFKVWHARMRAMLEELGLWWVVMSPYDARKRLGRSRRDEVVRADVRAVNILLAHVHPQAIGQFNIPEPVSSFELIDLLGKPPHFFRLPRELRDQIYELCVVKPFQDRSEFYRREAYPSMGISVTWRTPKMAFDVRRNGTHIEQHPPLLGVSRQIRSECDDLYWGKNKWAIELETISMPEGEASVHHNEDLMVCFDELKKRVEQMGGIDRFGPLRDLELGFNLWGHRTMRVLYEGDVKGLRLDVDPGLRAPGQKERFDHYLAEVEARREAKGWKGQGIIDFLVGDEKLWRTSLFA